MWQSDAVKNAKSIFEAGPIADALRAYGALVAAACGSNGCPSDQSSSVGQGGKEFSCTIRCTTSGLGAATGVVSDENLRLVTTSIRANSRTSARSIAMDNRAQICRGQNLAPISSIIAPTCE